MEYEEFEKLVIQNLYDAYNVIAVMIDNEIVYTVTGGKKKEWFPGATITLLFKGFRYTFETAKIKKYYENYYLIFEMHTITKYYCEVISDEIEDYFIEEMLYRKDKNKKEIW